MATACPCSAPARQWGISWALEFSRLAAAAQLPGWVQAGWEAPCPRTAPGGALSVSPPHPRFQDRAWIAVCLCLQQLYGGILPYGGPGEGRLGQVPACLGWGGGDILQDGLTKHQLVCLLCKLQEGRAGQ